jgi:hypothetical protein
MEIAPMSTEADIVERLPDIASRCSFEQDRTDIIAATNLITKLRAERDAVHKSYHLMASSRLEWRHIAETAARDMRERCAQRCEEIAQECMAGSLIDPSVHIAKKVAMYVAEQIRDLPTSVIATERAAAPSLSGSPPHPVDNGG